MYIRDRFVHGLGGASTNWTDLMALLARRLDCWALDLPGFGRSGPPADGSYRLGSHVRAVIGLLDARGGAPVHVLGNSLGGAVCTRVAATLPDLVRTLTLVSPALPNLDPRRISDPRLPLILLPGVRRVAQRRLNAVDARERALGVLRLCFYDPNRIHPDRIGQAVDPAARRDRGGAAPTERCGCPRAGPRRAPAVLLRPRPDSPGSNRAGRRGGPPPDRRGAQRHCLRRVAAWTRAQLPGDRTARPVAAGRQGQRADVAGVGSPRPVGQCRHRQPVVATPHQ